MIRILIIDDEPKARETVSHLLKLSFPQIEEVKEAESVSTGLQAIKTYKPNLVFLDIQLEDGSGFDILQKLDQIDFQIIFITAFNEYAVKAFKYAAIDYLMKPINPKEFIIAVKQAISNHNEYDFKTKIEAYMSHLKDSAAEHKKIILKTAESIHLIKVQDIIRCVADKGYTEFYLHNAKKILVSKGLKDFDDLLNDFGFIRTHQSHLINLDYIASFEKTDGGYILMTDGSTVPVSSRKKEYVFRVFEGL
jgi:two-component system LytT family response regulator